jgi:hypothetical protein
MTTFIKTDNQRSATKNAVSGRALVRVQESSWRVMPLAFGGIRRSFDPEAAGRRAVDKHGEALRRLSD